MTDLTTRPTEPGTPSPALGPVPVNGTAVGDRRTLRQVSRAEQDRLSADAEVERRARAARLDLELREQRQAAARRQRQAAEQDRQAHVEQRRARRAARHARLRAAAPRWADRALFVLPILFPMAVAWVGQIRFAMTVMHWPLPAAIVFAAGFELSTAYAARLDWLSRAAGDSALLFRGATWGFASGAAIMNYWHAAGPDFAPTGEAVSYGLMSITGVVLWELLSTYRHRTALRAKGKLPAARPRHGLARWVWFRPLTRLASLLALRDGYTTTDLAWQAALTAVDQYGSARGARKAVRAGRPVPRPGVLGDDEQNTRRDNGSGERDRGEGGRGRDVPGYQTEKEITCQHRERDKQVRDNNPLDIESRCKDRDIVRRYPKRDTVNPVEQRDSVGTTAVSDDYDRDDLPEPVNLKADREPTTGERRDLRDGMDDHDGATTNRDDDPGRHNPVTKEHGPHVDDELADHEKGRADGSSGGGEDRVAPPRTSKGAVIATMNTYARERIAQGISVTGADLDRHFGTRDYGRKVLRQLAAEARPDA